MSSTSKKPKRSLQRTSSPKKRRSDPTLAVTLELARAEDAGDPFAFRFAEQTYLLRQEGGGMESASFPWGAEVLEDLAAVSRPRPDRVAAQRLGDRLRAFLAAAGWERHEEAIAAALEEKRPIRVTVRSSAAEMYALPFELCTLPSTGQHLGELPNCLLRYEWPNTRTATPDQDPAPEGGRVVFAWSAAGGAVPAEAHVEALRAACKGGHLPFDPARDVIPHVSLARLKQALSEPGAKGAILHILCHGGAVASKTEAYGLVWNGEDDGGEPEVIDAGTLRQVLAPHAGSLRLVVLSACQGGAAGGPGNHLGSLAQAIHRVGIPAVVASRYPLSTEGSVSFAETFYRRLIVDHAPVEGAFLAGRDRLAERANQLDWASLQLYARAADGAEHRPIVLRPYRGLLAFQPEDRRLYFGREHEVERLVGLLRGGKRLVTLVGASGSGKSSLVMAGLVPAVEGGALGERPFRTLVLRPGPTPCQALWNAIATLARTGVTPGSQSGDARAFREQLEHRADTLAVTIDRILGPQEGDPGLLLVVDQFEELFILGGGGDAATFVDNPDATAFLDGLLHATQVRGGRVHAVLTMRADFLGQCLDHRGIAEQIRASVDFALPMTEAQIRETILRPAALAGIRFDEGVIDALLDALRDGGTESKRFGVTFTGGHVSLGAGKLPLLQFALEELWAHREGDRITWQSWRGFGGVRGALAKRADEVLSGSPPREQELARHVFGRLVQIGKGTADTRRRALRTELETIAPGEVRPVLDRWIGARLLTADQREVGVAHEALIREWTTLRRWIEEDREALRIRLELGHDAQRWTAGGRAPDDLWRGARLARFVELSREGRLPLAEDEAQFLAAAEARERREQADLHARLMRDYDIDFGVASRARAGVAIALGVLSAGVTAAWPRLWRTSHAGVIAALAIAVLLGVALVLAGKRSLLATRANRQLWAASAATAAAAAVSHAIAAAMGAGVEATVAFDLVMGAAFFTIMAIVFDPHIAPAAAFLTAAAIAASRAPGRVFDLAAAAFLLSNMALAFAWAKARARAAPPSQR